VLNRTYGEPVDGLSNSEEVGVRVAVIPLTGGVQILHDGSEVEHRR
jgi:hypothetical protein